MSAAGLAATVEELASTQLFAGLDRAKLRVIAERVERRLVAAGDDVIVAGDVGDALYVVVRGRLQAYDQRGGIADGVNEMGPGDVVGELALLSDRPRMASVRAIRDSELLRLCAADFHALVANEPGTLLHIAKTVIGHLERDSKPKPVAVSTIAVLPAGRTRPQIAAALARQFVTALLPDRAAVVDLAVVDRELGPNPTPGQVVALLDRIEAASDLVIFVADGDDLAWARRCARHADRVVLVADVGRPSSVRPVERVVPPHASTELVLLHPRDTKQPADSGRWLSRRSVSRHHQVRAGRKDDLARVARSLTGRSVSIVLGGGGPRGFAHLGVMQALEEAGYPIDNVGGTSIGALMGASVAMGWDHATRIANTTRALADAKRLFRPTLPVVALTSGKEITRLLRDPAYLGETAIEDFWLPYFCVSTNLTQARHVVHDQGPAWLAIRSSIGLPGIMPPVFDNGDLLVDGGVLNNLPVDVMRERTDGIVVAVDLEPEVDLRLAHEFPPMMSGWRVLANRATRNGKRLKIPNAVQVLMRAKQVGGEHAQRAVLEQTPVDLYLRPPIEAFGALNFSAGPALVDLAYRFTLAELEKADLTGR